MKKVEFKERTGYFNIDMKIHLNDFLITVFYMTIEKGSPTWSLIENTNVFYGIHYVLHGRGRLKIGDKSFDLVPGTFYCTHPQVLYTMVSDKSDPLGEAFIYFDLTSIKNKEHKKTDSFIDEELEEIARVFTSPAMKVGTDEGESQVVIRKIQLELETLNIGYYTKLHSLFCELFINASRSFIPDKTAHYSMPEMDVNEKRKLMIDFDIDLNFKTLTRETLAKKLNVRVRQLDRLIKEYYSSTFKELLIEKRIHKAKALLVQSELPISRIAEEVGLENLTYFSSIFKKHEGITPSTYRKQSNESNCN